MGNQYSFVGGMQGRWRVQNVRPVLGTGLDPVERLDIVAGAIATPPPDSAWVLRSFASNVRYAKRDELDTLRAVQPDLNRAEAVSAVLIPIKKSAQWWDMAQDERRAIFEEQSHHTAVGLEYLPGVARRLLHCRDLGEPFDFLTWFEFAPEHTAAFDQLLVRMRASKEWDYVEREVEVRLERDDAAQT
ncbi:chlorite dismutase family protein [Thermoleptolyngbya sp. M55_K2018_002]|uniref:chlorite dismutase family protein n=1 Tax=Thermoleptolyngbya sp. M55_K2018_002 TaxID=2747808 RepID=UPI0019F530A2|nr:chlorite dismutase family protein [Thermoleptolyngbya sp. M55_K2018_002]HIK41587.1 chlorite dismutase family protein [Thermoleptolyngbya sp. M55_K2018_002]